MSYYVYILRNYRNKLYIGQAKKLPQRLTDHFYEEIKYTRDQGGGFKLVYSEDLQTRAKKEALITGDLELLKKL